MPANDGFQGTSAVSNCYVFKSRLQEYAQKVGLPTPVYETIKEGPSHEPLFRSTVILKDSRYDSLTGFFNRKAAEQSAAEVALMELSKSSAINQGISQPVHETGLCKNLLQEYAQKMNYAIPLYECQKDESPGRHTYFSCTVEIGGIRYIGAAARTKKEAEIKAARTALLAIRSSPTELSGTPIIQTNLTVVPSKKRAVESVSNHQETANTPKPKKQRFKKKAQKKKLPRKKAKKLPQAETNNALYSTTNMDEVLVANLVSHAMQTGEVEEVESAYSVREAMNDPTADINSSERDTSHAEENSPFPFHLSGYLTNPQYSSLNPIQGENGISHEIASSLYCEDAIAFGTEVSKVTEAGEMAPLMDAIEG